MRGMNRTCHVVAVFLHTTKLDKDLEHINDAYTMSPEHMHAQDMSERLHHP